MNSAKSQNSATTQYTVVARRYRPQAFGDLVGQEHVSQALSNAIRQNRVGHAYLFTGARGVGKTSSARIFAKCLNCEQGPTGEPCNECDICQTVSLGEDIDVLEIDGASNRGIDEIRQLRSNAIVRPSRSRFKIYIIDEVHMLTQQAFNALLKTLEEPPQHVKFIFCTTDPQKIPITVLSRCQRFDFSPVQTREIVQRLMDICASEGMQADEQALAILARRATGSMRDSQSLLEQLFSFCEGSIGVDDVHRLLGTADNRRIRNIADLALRGEAGECMNQIAEAIQSGVDAGQLASQLLGYFRDLMAIRVGANPESLTTILESDAEELAARESAPGLESILAIVQILDQCVTRMQSSLHGRILLEIALVRISRLENLDLLADLVAQIGIDSPNTKPGGPTAQRSPVAAKKKEPVKPVSPPGQHVTGSAVPVDDAAADAVPAVLELKPSNLGKIWQRATKECGGMASEMAGNCHKLELKGGKTIAVTIQEPHVLEYFRRPDRLKSIKSAFRQITGRDLQVEFFLHAKSSQPSAAELPNLTRVQMIRQLEQNELIKSAIEVFDAEVNEFKDNRGKRV